MARWNKVRNSYSFVGKLEGKLSLMRQRRIWNGIIPVYGKVKVVPVLN
jgi:hypothetical protein